MSMDGALMLTITVSNARQNLKRILFSVGEIPVALCCVTVVALAGVLVIHTTATSDI